MERDGIRRRDQDRLTITSATQTPDESIDAFAEVCCYAAASARAVPVRRMASATMRCSRSG